MKTTTLFFAGAMALVPILSSAQQHVWRVNNTPGNLYDADFTTVVDAINGAAPGDTLHLEASTASYGQLDLDKELVILGPGYFLDDNFGLQASALAAMVTEINFLPGSENSAVSGLHVTGGGGASIGTGEVTLERNRLNYGILIPNGIAKNNIVIKGNWIGQSINTGSTIQAANLLITNNIIQGDWGGYPNTTTGSFTYNVTGQASSFYGMTCTNNIFRLGTTQVNDNQFSDNYFHNTHPAVPGTGNAYVPMTTVFEITPAATDSTYVLDQNFVGQLTSGAFAGSTPYVLSGIPPIPTIYELSTPASATQGDVINVTLSTRSNN